MQTSTLPSAAQTISPSVTLEWYDDRKIVCATVTDVARTTIDQLERALTPIVTGWPDPFQRMIYDFSDPRVKPTPYSNARARALEELRPDLNRYVAIVMNRTFAVQLIQLFIRAQDRHNRHLRIFFTRQDALRWLIGIKN
jgi:hypothetical protein